MANFTISQTIFCRSLRCQIAFTSAAFWCISHHSPSTSCKPKMRIIWHQSSKLWSLRDRICQFRLFKKSALLERPNKHIKMHLNWVIWQICHLCPAWKCRCPIVITLCVPLSMWLSVHKFVWMQLWPRCSSYLNQKWYVHHQWGVDAHGHKVLSCDLFVQSRCWYILGIGERYPP